MRLTARDVSYRYGGARARCRGCGGRPAVPLARELAVGGVSLEVESGRALGLMGRTGSGKSTLLELLAGLLRPAAGEVLLDGADVCLDRAARSRLERERGMVFQLPERQFFELTVEREVTYALRQRGEKGGAAREAAAWALGLVGLDLGVIGDRSPFALSGGQQRRVALASVLAARPRLLLLDEPTAGLDPDARCDCLTAIRACVADGAAVVMASHDADAVAHVCDEVALLDEGSLVLAGPTRDLLGNAALMREHGLDGCQPARAAAALADAGVGVPGGVLTTEELVGQIADALLARRGAGGGEARA